jgi:hypothetical protein
MFKCPNGTESITGSSSINDCVASGLFVNRRISAIPSYVDEKNGPLAGYLKNVSDFWEIGGADTSNTPYGSK